MLAPWLWAVEFECFVHSADRQCGAHPLGWRKRQGVEETQAMMPADAEILLHVAARERRGWRPEGVSRAKELS